MVNKIKEQVDVPLVVGVQYQTKFATGEKFTITEINTNKFGKITRIMGVYSNSPDLGACPINEDRLIHFKEFTGKIKEVCSNCGDILYCE